VEGLTARIGCGESVLKLRLLIKLNTTVQSTVEPQMIAAGADA
jgi:hypothetical protein